MTPRTHTIRRMLTAIALSAAAALLAVPLAQARLDDYATGIAPEPRASKPIDHILDDWFRDPTVAKAAVTDNILDVSARDTVQAPSSTASSTPDLRGDYMFQQYFRDAAKANDHVLDVSARDNAAAASVAPEPTDGTDWGEIGVGIALALGGALLLVVLLAVGLEVRHSRHRLRSV